MSRISIEDLKSYLWGSAVLLRTHIDAGSYKQYIFPLLFYKRLCDVYDEEYDIALKESNGDNEYAKFDENHRFSIPENAHWKKVREASTDIGKILIKSFRAIEKANKDKLTGIFGDAPWSNKERLPDSLLKEMIEHFSSKTLSLENCPEDELGTGYEYLIKKFADDSGHTAQEFYTNRTLVHLMTELLQPKSGESIYDPTCGSAGMLISSIAYLKNNGKEWRNVKLYGQELNNLTSSIGRMNLFLHGIKDFQIINDDTLSHPGFIERGQIKKFDVVLANPPYSIKKWNREMFANDPYGRNILGTPPQGRADYAFLQHILCSMNDKTGRCAILFPHGVLFRNEEAEMREKLIKKDYIDCIIGLAPNLFFNSPMEACILICNKNKPAERKNKILFINALNEVTRKNSQSYLEDKHIEKISNAYHNYVNDGEFSAVKTIKEIEGQKFLLSLPLYTKIESEEPQQTEECDLHTLISKLKDENKLLKEMYVKLKEKFRG